MRPLHVETALNDNTMSTEQARRAIRCERSNDKYAWMPTRRSLEPLDANGTQIKHDKERGKLLRKILRRQRRNHPINTVGADFFRSGFTSNASRPKSQATHNGNAKELLNMSKGLSMTSG
jgi:hypothetical protein